MKIKIKNAEIQEILSGSTIPYPKYATQLMNLANSNAQGTRAKVVGQLSELIQEFEGKNLSDWEAWYKELHPEAIENAVDRIYPMIKNFKEVIKEIDRDMIKQWVEELVITKTFMGLKFQGAILAKLASNMNLSYRLAEPVEESKGIDGYIGNTAVSIKPISYQSKILSEKIEVPIIFYDKKKDGITITYDFEIS